jgi:hypothetical protein
MTALKNAARMERMLLRDHTIYAAETITPLGLPQDFVSNQLIAVSGGMTDKRPFQTSTDGNNKLFIFYQKLNYKMQPCSLMLPFIVV